MSRWIEITGTSKVDLKTKAKKVSDKLHEILSGTLPSEAQLLYHAARYAKLGSSIRLHKTQMKIIIKIPEESHLWWRKIKDRLGEVPEWITPKQIANDNSNYFNKDI